MPTDYNWHDSAQSGWHAAKNRDDKLSDDVYGVGVMVSTMLE